MGDMFGEWVPAEWISAVVQVAEKCPHHTFLFLTKNPARYNEIWWPPNCWIGTTVESSLTASRLVCISKVKAPVRFVSFEPLTGAVAKFDLEALRDVQWVIIGAMTGPGAVKPKPEWVSRIINRARDFNIPVFLKANLGWPEQIREFPKTAPLKNSWSD
jgi:protein gp37